MAGAFSFAIAQVQSGLVDLALSSPANQPPHDSSTRKRQLPPERTLRLFVQQVAHGNVACAAVRHLNNDDFTDSAWCQARARLPIESIERANRRVVESALKELDDEAADVVPRWCGRGQACAGHRVFILDGTNDSMPDTPELRKHYGVPAPVRQGLGFPTSHLLMCMDHRAGLIHDCIDGPLTRSDLADTPTIHERLEPGDIVLADEYFSGFAHMALILRARMHFVMPILHQRIVDFDKDRAHIDPRKGMRPSDKGKPRSRLVKKLGHDDQIVEYTRPTQKTPWLSDEKWESIPQTIRVREIRRTVHRKGFRPIVVTIVTSLLDPELYPAEELVELRLTRWLIETGFRHLKITLGMDVLKCKTLDGVRKERLVFILVYNLIRRLMIRAARAQGVNVHRISFANTLAWLRLAHHADAREQTLPAFMVNPIRNGRLEPRAIKRSRHKFSLMTQPRATLKAQLRATHADTA